MQDRSNLLTEQRLADSMQLDAMSIEDAVALMNHEDRKAIDAVTAEHAAISAAIRVVAEAFKHGGRLFYVGAGTSGRLGVLDASECPPTFRTDPRMVQGIIAGGDIAMFRAQEGAEDRADDGAAQIDAREITPADVVMGIAAGGTTPFVHGALRRAAERGAKTIFLACVAPTPNEANVDVAIRPLVGPEVLTGSTRLKAATATKLVLNMITTLSMVQLGKVHENLMVDLKASNQKLRDRAARIVQQLTGVARDAAIALVDRAEGHVKSAVVMHFRSTDLAGAKALLDAAGGRLRDAIGRGG